MVNPVSPRMGAADQEQRQRELQLAQAEAALQQQELSVSANEGGIEDAQQNLDESQSQVDEAKAQLSQSKAQIDTAKSEVSKAKVDDSVNPSFGSSQPNRGDVEPNAMQYVYTNQTRPISTFNQTEMPEGLYPGVNPDVMNQIIRNPEANSVKPINPEQINPQATPMDAAATQADKQPEPPRTTLEINTPTQAALGKAEPEDNLDTREIRR